MANPIYLHALGALLGATVFVLLSIFVFPEDITQFWIVGLILFVVAVVGFVAIAIYLRGMIVVLAAAADIAFVVALIIELARGVL